MEFYRDKFAIPWIPPWVTGDSRRYSWPHLGTLTNVAPGATSLYAVAVFVPNPAGVLATSIGVQLTTNGTATHVARCSIYADREGIPGGLLLDAGTFAVDAGAPAYVSATISRRLRQGWYWLAFSTQSGTFQFSASGFHSALHSRTTEIASTNNAMGKAYTPGAAAMTLITLTGHPPAFPDNGRATHINVPRVFLGV